MALSPLRRFFDYSHFRACRRVARSAGSYAVFELKALKYDSRLTSLNAFTALRASLVNLKDFTCLYIY